MKQLLAQQRYNLNPIEPPGPSDSPWNPDNSPVTQLENIVSFVIGFMTIAAGIYLLFLLIIGAYTFMTAGGDKGKLQEARQKLLTAVVGFIILVAAYSLVRLFSTVLGYNILNLEELIGTLWS